MATLQDWSKPIKALESHLQHNPEYSSSHDVIPSKLSLQRPGSTTISTNPQQMVVQTTIGIFNRAFTHSKTAKLNDIMVNVELLAAAVSWFTQGNTLFPESAQQLGEYIER